MKTYFAPLEGLTDSVYRRLHHKYFPGADRYYTPFFSPTVHRSLTPKEARELPVASSLPVTVVPQILTKNAEDFLWFAGEAASLGYTEVNLNLGCPSGTVVSKGKGSGMLQSPDTLDAFFENILKNAPVSISVKTRLGVSNPAEFPRLLEIFNRYPISELTLHPRVRTQFYKGEPDMEAFRFCYENSVAPVCYNGNLFTKSEMDNISTQFPNCSALMLGRGLIADPGLVSGGTKRETLTAFTEELLKTYIDVFGSERNAMFRLKENWFYLLNKFENSEKLGKRLRKTTDMDEFRSITREILETLPMRDNILPNL
ncbi:MAG: tRNA-dihydrouridine synthase family protein [Ruminococcaceae bacterium]|nr:tRNA-dihydrouridine synthase family protein [Oscillospiraceae bacterium]